jgi:hypothetical protein
VAIVQVMPASVMARTMVSQSGRKKASPPMVGARPLDRTPS